MAGDMALLKQTTIGKCIIENNIKEMRTLIADNIEDFSFVDQRQNTYLHLLCTTYRPYIFSLLITHPSTNINAQNKNGKTALDLGAHNSQWSSSYCALQPGLRQAIRDHDLERIHYLFSCWSLIDNIVEGRTARQYAAFLSHHDIVALIDRHKFTLRAMQAVLTGNHSSLKYVTSRAECNVNSMQRIGRWHPVHILQHALRLHDTKSIHLLLEAGANINQYINVKSYVKAPLYFELLKQKTFTIREIRKILDHGCDFALKDERGRSCLMYVVDNYKNKQSLEIVDYLLEKKIDITTRDVTGCTARDAAMFARRQSIVEAIDGFIVDLIQASDMVSLRRLLMGSYEHVFFEYKYQYRDTWLIAAGNDTKEVTKYLQGWNKNMNTIKRFHNLIREGILQEAEDELAKCKDPGLLLGSKDKGGRTALMLSLLHQYLQITHWIIQQVAEECINARDNCGRTALHYAHGLRMLDVAKLLQNSGADKNILDNHFHAPWEYGKQKELQNTILRETIKIYGMEKELHCLTQYEKLLRIIRSPHRTMKEFNSVLKQLNCPVAKLTQMLRCIRAPLVARYRDLLLCAIDHNRADIAKKLVNLNMDCNYKEQYSIPGGDKEYHNAVDRAQLMDMYHLAEYMRTRKNTQGHQRNTVTGVHIQPVPNVEDGKVITYNIHNKGTVNPGLSSENKSVRKQDGRKMHRPRDYQTSYSLLRSTSSVSIRELNVSTDRPVTR